MNAFEVNTDTLTMVNPVDRITQRAFNQSDLGTLRITTPDGKAVFDDQYVNFGATGVEEVWQNVKYILLTEYFSVPLDREFGMDFVMVDKPIPVAEAVLAQEVAMKVSLYEPRAEFREVRYDGVGIQGKLNPTVVIYILATDELPSRYPGDVTPSAAQAAQYYSYAVTVPTFLDFVSQLSLKGAQGDVGPIGPPGPKGDAATVDAGVTYTGLPGSAALVVNVGDIHAAIFDFTVPEGIQGQRGSMWFDGPDDPPDPIPNALPGDYYLNTVSGDVWAVS
jgi:hypothetical protein